MAVEDNAIIATPKSIRPEEFFDEVTECKECGSELVQAAQQDIRLDNDRSMNDSQLQDPAAAGVKIAADLAIKICTSCQWSVIKFEPTSYAGF